MSTEDRMFRAIRDAMGWGGRGVELNTAANNWSMREAREFLRSLEGYGFTVVESVSDSGRPQAPTDPPEKHGSVK
jgi:hypothetical protein